MIAGDEGKPMSIMERISDAPCDPEPYIDYVLADYKFFLDQCRQMTTEARAAHRWGVEGWAQRDFWLSSVVMTLEDIKQKMHRPAPRTPER